MVKRKINWQEQINFLMPRILLLSLLTNIFLMGGLMNLVVTSNNGGKMPVYTQETFDTGSRHFTFTDPESVKNFALSDIYSINLGNAMTLYYSIGDILIVISSFIMITYCVSLLVYNVINWTYKLKEYLSN